MHCFVCFLWCLACEKMFSEVWESHVTDDKKYTIRNHYSYPNLHELGFVWS